jgi:hypothetical protein
MKKVKMIDVYNSVGALNKLLEMKMAVKTSMKVVNIVKEINLHLAEAEKLRNNLLQKHGRKDKEGTYNVPDSKKEKFIEELNENLLGTEVEIRSDLLKEQDFDVNFSITPAELSSISFLLEEN